MNKKIPVAAAAALFIACAGRSEQMLSYEPHVERLAGVVINGERQHPNGEMFPFAVLRLDQPVSISAADDSLNVAESGVEEIQIFSAEKSVSKRLRGLNGKRAVATGKIFHAHTAWHVRTLVMDVTTVEKTAPLSK